MVDTRGYFYAACYLGFDKNGPILNLFKYKTDGTLEDTRTENIEPWIHFTTGSINTTPTNDSDFKKYIHNTLQPVIAQDIDFYDSEFWVGAYVPPYNYRSGSPLYGGGFVVQRINKEFSAAPMCSKYADSAFDNVLEFSPLRFYLTPELNNSYVIPNGQLSFSFFRFKHNGDVYGNLYQIAQQTMNSYKYRVYSLKGDKYFLTGGDNTGTGFETYTHRHINMTPRILKIGSSLYSVFFCDAMSFHLYKQSLSEVRTRKKTNVSSHDMESMLTNYQKDTPYSYDFCILNKDGTPCTPSSPDSTTEDTRKIWCLFCFGCGGYGKLKAPFGWSDTQCNYDQKKICGVLRSYYLPIDDAGSTTNTGDWVQNSIYITEAERSKDKTTINGGDALWQIHFNSHKMVAYHASSGRNYFIFAYCYPNKKKQLYITYAPYYVDADHNVRLLTKTQLSSGDWGDSFGDLTSCSRIISMDLVGEHLWICFMNADETEVHYFHCLAKDLVCE